MGNETACLLGESRMRVWGRSRGVSSALEEVGEREGGEELEALPESSRFGEGARYDLGALRLA